MRKHLCVLIHIRIKLKLVLKHYFGPPVFLPTVPRRCFFCGSFLLFLFHVCLCNTVVSVFCSLVITCWGKYWPLGSRVSCVFLWCGHFPKWWIEPCVVLDCIDSWSLSSSLLRSLSTYFLSILMSNANAPLFRCAYLWPIRTMQNCVIYNHYLGMQCNVFTQKFQFQWLR